MFNFDTAPSRKNTASLKWDRYKDQDILPFWVADMDFLAAEPIQRAIESRVSHGIFGYTVPPDGLVDAVSDHLLNHYQWKIDPSWIVWLPGVVSGLAVSCRAYCRPNHEILVNTPIYHHFFDAHDDASQKLVRVPLSKHNDRWTFDIPELSASVNEKTDLMMLCSPHNPTGTVFTEAELQAVAKICQDQDVVLVSDEIHCDLVFDRSVKHIPTAVACPELSDRLVTLMSGSKTWNIAGLNCSFAIISNPELREQFQNARGCIVPNVPPLAYVATEAAYRDGGPWREALLDYLAENFALIQAELSADNLLVVEPIQATYLAWIDATALNLSDTQGFFEQHGVGLSGGEQFGQSQFVRMNFACPRSTLKEGLRRMRQALTEL